MLYCWRGSKTLTLYVPKAGDVAIAVDTASPKSANSNLNGRDSDKAFFLVDGIVSSWREDVKNHILTDFCRSACFACQLTGLCHPAAFYKVWIHLYIELHCRQFNIASQYVAGIDLHFSGPHWCIVFLYRFDLHCMVESQVCPVQAVSCIFGGHVTPVLHTPSSTTSAIQHKIIDS